MGAQALHADQQPSGSRPAKIYECDVCGEQAPWSREWSHWGSIRLSEDWGLQVLCCSASCRSVLKRPEELLDRKAAAMGLVRRGGKYVYPHSKSERIALTELVEAGR